MLQSVKKIHISYYKFAVLLSIIIVICILKEDAAIIRQLLYIAAGIVLAAKVRQEKVTAIEYLALIVLVYLDISFFVPILSIKGIIFIILKIGGLYGIIQFLIGILMGYILIPSKILKES